MAKLILFLFGVCVIQPKVLGQDQRVVDSLKTILQQQKGNDRFSVLYELAFEFIGKENEHALHIIEEAENVALSSGDSLWIVKAMRVKAELLFALGRIPEAVSTAERLVVRPNLIRYEPEYFRVVNLLGFSNSFMSRFDKALEYHLAAYSKAEELNNREFIATSLSNIGLVYYKLKDYEKALNYFNESRKVKDLMNEIDYASRMNMSLCYSYLGDFVKARMYLNESVARWRHHSRPDQLVHIKYASGCIYFGMHQYEESEREFSQSLKLSQDVGATRLQLDNIYMLTKIYIHRRKFKEAEKLLKAGEQIAASGTPFNLEVIKMYEQLGELFMTVKDYEKASHYQSMYIQLKDSVYNESVMTGLMKVESDYIQRKTGAKIAAQAQVIHLNEEIIRRQASLNRLSWLVALLTTIIVLFLFKQYRRKKALNLLLDKKIKERTRQLEISRKELLLSLEQEKLKMQRVSSAISEQMNTLQGLCFIANRELSDPSAQILLGKIHSATIRMNGYLRTALDTRLNDSGKL